MGVLGGSRGASLLCAVGSKRSGDALLVRAVGRIPGVPTRAAEKTFDGLLVRPVGPVPGVPLGGRKPCLGPVLLNQRVLIKTGVLEAEGWRTPPSLSKENCASGLTSWILTGGGCAEEPQDKRAV